MAEAGVMGFQAQEYARASIMYSDLELAFQLQLNEALAASAASSGVKYKPEDMQDRSENDESTGGRGDRSIALLAQSRELKRREQEMIDKEKAKTEGQGLWMEAQRRLHDKKFARSIEEMSLEEWDNNGDRFELPFLVDDCNFQEDEVCSMFFAKVREDPGHVGIAWAVTDPAGHVLFQQSKYLGHGVSAAVADYTALINGLAYARSAGVKNIIAHGDSFVISSQVSGQWRARSSKCANFLEQVHEHRRQLDSLVVDVVPKTKNQYVINLARQAVQSFVAELLKNGIQGHVRSESSEQGKGEDCPICFERTHAADMFIVRTCSHRFCLQCLSQHVEIQVKANQVPVRCPQDCSNHVELDQCQPFLSSKLLESYARGLTEASIPESDRVYCPFPNCSALMSKSGLNPSVTATSSRHPHATSIGCCECMECHRLFCVECRVPWHADMSCADYQKLPPDERDAEDFKLYKLASNKNWQRCKKCRRMIELDQGCYHMTCRCGHEFCYTCGAEWKNKQATCKCKLWDENNIIDALSDAESEFESETDNEFDGTDNDSEPEDFPQNLQYKTKICRHWVNGHCWLGERCTFAHGHDELRQIRYRF